MIDLAALSASAVTALLPWLGKIADGSMETLGAKLTDFVLGIKKHDSAQAALDDLGKQADDADAQAALRLQLRKAMADDPELVKCLQTWLADQSIASTTEQNVVGNNNKVAQTIGSGNQISIS